MVSEYRIYEDTSNTEDIQVEVCKEGNNFFHRLEAVKMVQKTKYGRQ